MVLDERITRGMLRRVESGGLIGRTPYGYILKDNEILIIPEEADIVQQIFRMYFDERKGFADIAYFLNSQGLLKRGKSWRRCSVKRTVENRVYYGVTKMKDKEFKGDFPAIITEVYIEPGEKEINK